MKKFNLKQLSLSVTTAIGLAVTGVATTTSQASDIEIYTTADKAQKTIVMMLDTSGSMSVYPQGISACDVDASQLQAGHPTYGYYGWVKIVNGKLADSKEIDVEAFHGRWCLAKDGRTRYYDRMTKLKEAVFTLMNSQALDDSLVVGVGVFTDGTKGSIQVPAVALTESHRNVIKNYIRGIGGSGGTPTANAYAEAAAYLLGTTTLSNPAVVTLEPQKNDRFTKQSYVQDARAGLENTFWACTTNGQIINGVRTPGYDTSGACQVIAGSPGAKTRATLLNEGYKVEPCRASVFNTGRECMYKNGDMVDGYIPAVTVDTATYSGFSKSVSDAKKGGVYKSPLPTAGRECSGQSIYFLTDGFPNSVKSSQQLMRNALADKAGDFPTLADQFVGNNNYLPSIDWEGMAPAGELAKRLRDPARNPQGAVIKTALVGFGRDFAEADKYKKKLTDADGVEREYYDCTKIGTREIRNACNFSEKSHDSLPGVGGYGEGGFFYAEQADDLVKSFLAVAKDIKTEFTPVVTGSPTIPLDALLAGRLSSQAYYGSFTPRPDTGQQLWTGDMNKYNVVDGVLKTGTSGDTNLFKSDGNLNDVITGLWDEGVKSKLALRNQENINSGATKTERGRIILTNRTIENGVAKNSSTLQDVTATKLFDDSELGKDVDRIYWLNALGYNIDKSENIDNVSDLDIVLDKDGKEIKGKPELRQIGATMHSKPILLTQKGRIDTGRNADGKFSITVQGREDYLLFGSTQGILHVIDNATGKEKFAFIPHEMMEKQKQAFLSEGSTSGGKDKLFYGIDGEWVAHTQYVPASDSDPTLTVGDSELTEDDNTEGSLHLRGMQWVYGGLRMGGKSYYALDLSNMNEPKLKFHIDPENGVVHTGDNTISYPELRHMGQSWSKPALGYVRWNGQQKLVMFVGGGYDMGYEDTTYKQTSKEGAGVYMFDASSGELLWWASSHSAGGSRGVEMTRNADLQYSVVGINTFDRDKDGLIDTLYFGDLAGQAFRVDLNNESQTTENNTSKFGHRVTRILNEHRADGKSPRFYLMPNLSVHSVTTNRQGVVIGNGEPFLLASFSSGDSSSPLAGIEASVQGVSRTRETAEDGIFVVYDNDVGKSSLYVADATDNTAGFRAEPLADGGKLQEYDAINGVPQITTEDGKKVFNRGWKFIFPENKVETSYGRYKILQQPRILTELLFVEAYNKDESNASSACGGGVRGTAYSFQYCLPTGQCQRNIHGFDSTSNTVQGEKKGPGNLGGSLATKDDKFVVNTRGGTSNCVGDACKQLPSGYQGELKQGIKQLRWYESQ